MCAAKAQVQFGRLLANEPRANLTINAGQIASIEGFVQETTRPYYDLTAPEKNLQFAESFTLKELGFEGGYGSYGLSLRNAWSFFTLELDAASVTPSVRARAVRDYYLGVSDVDFRGRSYEYMMIPSGTEFSADMRGAILGLRGFFTPLSVGVRDAFEFTPMLGAGVNAFAAEFEVDAGPAQGVIEYEIPPRQYVVRGRGTGWTGFVLPELGMGAEVRWRGGSGERRGPGFNLRGYYAFSDFSGSSSDIGISSRHEKVLDVEADHYRGSVLVSFPLSRKTDLLLGFTAEHMKATAEIKAKDRPPEEIERLREKFNKFVNIELTTYYLMLGLAF